MKDGLERIIFARFVSGHNSKKYLVLPYQSFKKNMSRVWDDFRVKFFSINLFVQGVIRELRFCASFFVCVYGIVSWKSGPKMSFSHEIFRGFFSEVNNQ